MKKIILILLLLIVSLHACECEDEIDDIFETIEEYIIETNVEPTEDAINDTLIPQIKTNQESIDKQNEYLEKLLKAEKLKSFEANKLVFQLEKLLNMNALK